MNKMHDILFDFLCVASFFGIWPRFIEPKLLNIQKLDLKIKNLHPGLEGLRALHYSDIHFSASSSPYLLNKVLRVFNEFQPHLCLFTGDLITHSNFEDPKNQLRDFLLQLQPPLGSFFVLGNHDYEKYATLCESGYVDVLEEKKSYLLRVFKRFFFEKRPFWGIQERLSLIEENYKLSKLLKETGHVLLHNESRQVKRKGASLNIVGLGDLWLRRFLPEKAFANYDSDWPGIVLSHNPDTFVELCKWPGDLVLSGHTHGGQVNLPFISKRLIFQEHMEYIRGYYERGDKRLYVSPGLSSPKPFRLFCPPEILLVSLSKS